jgi:hypothetical protein
LRENQARERSAVKEGSQQPADKPPQSGVKSEIKQTTQQNDMNLDNSVYLMKLREQDQKLATLQIENERLRHFLPDSYTEMRLKEK